jgi:hypothetical protein
MTIDLKSNIAEIVTNWKKKPVEMVRAMEKGLDDGMRLFEGQRIIRGQLSGRKNASYGLNSGTGNARNSINVKTDHRGLETVSKITVASRAWYLKVHQHYNFNGYIKPRNAMLLAIPIHPAARGKSPKDFAGGLIFIKPPGKTPILIREVRRGGSVKVAGKSRSVIREDIMFILKPRVYIPKRLYFYEEFNTIGQEMIKRNIMERLREAANAN